MASKTSGTPRKPRPSELMAVELRDLQIAVGILSSEIDELKYETNRRERLRGIVEQSRQSVRILHERITKTQSASIGWQLRRFGLWLIRGFQ